MGNVNRHWHKLSVASAVLLIPALVGVSWMFAPKRTAFLVPLSPLTEAPVEPKKPEGSGKAAISAYNASVQDYNAALAQWKADRQNRDKQEESLKRSAHAISVQIASAGLSCAVADLTRIAWFSDACEGQTATLDLSVNSAQSSMRLARLRETQAVSDELEAECRRDPTACQKKEVANAADEGEQ